MKVEIFLHNRYTNYCIELIRTLEIKMHNHSYNLYIWNLNQELASLNLLANN